MKRVLLIDDVRTEVNLPQHAQSIDMIARNYWAGIDALLYLPKWDLLLLDHDLSSFNPGDGKERTGYDIMCWLEEFTAYLPGEIEIVSANPVGRKRMQLVIEKLYKKDST
jgi:hypothetical protein